MAIVPLEKMTVCGPAWQKAEALEALQELGCMHVVPLADQAAQSTGEPVHRHVREALRYLQSSPVQRPSASPATAFDREGVVARVLEVRSCRAALIEERDTLDKALADVEPWGEFRLPAEPINGGRAWFYLVPVAKLATLPEKGVWQVVGRDGREARVVAWGSSPETLPFPHVILDPRPLSELRLRREAVEDQLEQLQWERASLTRFLARLREDMDAADDAAAHESATSASFDNGSLFAISGWVPQAARDDVLERAQRLGLAVTWDAAQPSDRPPTMLRNPERVAGAEGCVTFYVTPSYHAWDPTTIVFFSFSLFFAMIVADAGYGLLFAVGLALFWRRLRATASGRRVANLLLGIVSCTVLYGVLVGSYFGVAPPEGGWLDRCRVRFDGQPMMENRNGMMLLSVAIGVLHLTLANVIQAWRRRGAWRSLGYLGWGLVMIGAFLWGAEAALPVPGLDRVGQLLAAAGGVAVICFSSERTPSASLWRTGLLGLVDGVMQLANVSKAFGDVLSYLRLFALGLASAQLAVTFNQLGSDMWSRGGAGVLVAILIFAVGHGINLLLGVMGGVVHGLRLNCIEFFNWSLTEEGVPFQPFTKKVRT